MLEEQADEMRAQLATTLERLDKKRHDIVKLANVPEQIEEHVLPVVAASALVLVGAGVMLSWGFFRAAHRPELRRKQRIEALRRAWQHPERVGRSRSVAGDIVRRALTGLVTTVAMELVKRTLQGDAVHALLAPTAKKPRPARVAAASGAVPEVEEGLAPPVTIPRPGTAI